MSPVSHRIHPGFPVAWEDVDTLRFGFEGAAIRVHRPTAGQQRFIGSLRVGIDKKQIPREARRAGVTSKDAKALLAKLAPVIRPVHAVTPRFDPLADLRVLLCDDGREVAGLRDALLATQLCTLESSDSADNSLAVESTDLVVLVERFLEPFERAQQWLISELPMLPLRFSDRSIFVGPLIGPEGNPCHTCVTLRLIDQDAALPVLAAQLYGVAPASESEAGAHMTAAWAAMLIRSWRARDPKAHKTMIEIPMCNGVVSGPVRFRRVTSHPECACNSFNQRSRPPL